MLIKNIQIPTSIKLYYFNNLKLDNAIKPIPMIPIKAAMPDEIIPNNNKVAEVNAVINPEINRIMLIFLLLSILIIWSMEESDLRFLGVNEVFYH